MAEAGFKLPTLGTSHLVCNKDNHTAEGGSPSLSFQDVPYLLERKYSALICCHCSTTGHTAVCQPPRTNEPVLCSGRSSLIIPTVWPHSATDRSNLLYLEKARRSIRTFDLIGECCFISISIELCLITLCM